MAREASEIFLAAPWLAEVEPALRRAMLTALVAETKPAGALLLEQDHPNDHLSFLIEGSAIIERKRAGGRVETIATLNAPTVFGTTTFFGPKAPSFSVRASGDVRVLTLHHAAHDQLRRDNPAAAEALAVAMLRVLSERFDQLDQMFSQYMTEHPDDRSKVNEWAGFRARLFEELGPGSGR